MDLNLPQVLSGRSTLRRCLDRIGVDDIGSDIAAAHVLCQAFADIAGDGCSELVRNAHSDSKKEPGAGPGFLTIDEMST